MVVVEHRHIMKTYQTSIDSDVRSILERSVITDSTLALPPGQLDRKLYIKVNQVLEAAGGKWNRSKKVHIFSSDPRQVLGLALETGGIVNTKKTLGQFFTPIPLARLVCQRAHIMPHMDVLEPSAGHGAIALQAMSMMANAASTSGHVQCVDIDPANVAFLKKNCFPDAIEADFLFWRPAGDKLFDRIVANPPFNGHADILHVNRMMEFLAPGGRLAAIMSAGVTFIDSKLGRTFREMVARHNGTIEPLPEGSFVESGTEVNSVLVTLEN